MKQKRRRILLFKSWFCPSCITMYYLGTSENGSTRPSHQNRLLKTSLSCNSSTGKRGNPNNFCQLVLGSLRRRSQLPFRFYFFLFASSRPNVQTSAHNPEISLLQHLNFTQRIKLFISGFDCFCLCAKLHVAIEMGFAETIRFRILPYWKTYVVVLLPILLLPIILMWNGKVRLKRYRLNRSISNEPQRGEAFDGALTMEYNGNKNSLLNHEHAFRNKCY